ncbi:MAG: ABC transporter permease [Planctomycetes bacterium]|nr:ABC transporter permease [Planctomycetota bacterium]
MKTLATLTPIWRRIPPVIYMLVLGAGIFTCFAKNFLSVGNAFNILQQASPLLVLAIGETLAILVGGIDLSVGYLMSFAGLMTAFMLGAGFPLPVAILLAVLIAGAFGLVNGVLVAKFRMPYFIATFGVGYIVFGLGLLFSGGMSVPALQSSFRFIADGRIAGFPVIILVAMGIFLLMGYCMRYTPFGRNVYSLGGNREALYLSGVNVTLAEVKVFVVSGLLAGCAGVMFASRAASGHAGSGMGYEFDAVAATIIGGNSFAEGRGNISKTILGVLFISLLRNGLNMSGVTPQIQSFLVGVIVVVAISIDVLSKKGK